LGVHKSGILGFKGFRGLWVYGLMGLWVYGFMGLGVKGLGFRVEVVRN